MTPEQEATDKRYVKWILRSIWICAGLLAILTVFYIEYCRQKDLRKIQEWIDNIRSCSCSVLGDGNNHNTINIEKFDTSREATVKEIMKIKEILKFVREQEKNDLPGTARRN